MRYEKEDMFTVIHTFFPKLDASVYNYPMWQPIHTSVQDTDLHKKDDLDPYLVKTIKHTASHKVPNNETIVQWPRPTERRHHLPTECTDLQ